MWIHVVFVYANKLNALLFLEKPQKPFNFVQYKAVTSQTEEIV